MAEQGAEAEGFGRLPSLQVEGVGAMVARFEGPLARLFGEGPVAGLTDGQLLDQFASRRGDAAEAAFEALVKRHGPMVSRVCRSWLRDEHDIEDAFQATFLVLVRRAGSIGERDLLAPWLYGVAHRVARKARAIAAKRRGREGGPAEIDPPARFDSATEVQVELGPVLHEEVNRLPAKYRQPVVLCHLQGLTHAEAAQELAWPVGTVSVRLVRARKILADRLTRRGVSASAALVATTLAGEASAAVLAPSWVHAAAVAALTAATGLPPTTAASAAAVTLARKTSMTMLLSSWKWLTIPATVALATSTAGAIAVLYNDGNGSAVKPAGQLASVLAPPQIKRELAEQTPVAAPPNQAVGVANLELNLTEVDREIEVGGTTHFDFIIKNRGPKDATNVRLSGATDDLKVTKPYYDIANGLFSVTRPNAGQRAQFVFPTIPKLAVGEAVSLGVDVEGLKKGQGAIALELAQGDAAEANKIRGSVEVAITDAAEQPVVAVPPVFALGPDQFELRHLPPDYFNLPAADPSQPGSPRPVRIGQTVQIEVLEALPGRPLSGERIVRGDGTISLGFYGNLYVNGLNRDQIKVKLVEQLRTYLTDSVLGLWRPEDEGAKVVAVPPLNTNRVFVDDQPGPLPKGAVAAGSSQPQAASAAIRPASGPVLAKVGDILAVEVLEALPGRPITGERVVRPDGTISLGFYGDVAVAGLTRDQIKEKVIDHLRKFLNEKLLQADRVFVDDSVGFDWQHPTEPAADGKVRVGQILVVEVLKALANRPITGERIVHPDGTINLGFYGNLPVVGLTRDQMKVKVIELLRAKVSDADLGLIKEVNGLNQPVAPIDSSRVFVDDVIPRPQPRTNEQVKKLSDQVTDLTTKLDEALAAINQLRRQAAREPAPK